MSLWRVLYLAEKYGMTMHLEDISREIGIAPSTIRNRRAMGDFDWLRLDGRQLSADVADVAEYLEQRRTAREDPEGPPRHSASESDPSDARSLPSSRRHRTPVPEGQT